LLDFSTQYECPADQYLLLNNPYSDPSEEDDVDSEELKVYKQLEQRDRRRWTVADRYMVAIISSCINFNYVSMKKNLQ
jgi:hypothetical protein